VLRSLGKSVRECLRIAKEHSMSFGQISPRLVHSSLIPLACIVLVGTASITLTPLGMAFPPAAGDQLAQAQPGAQGANDNGGQPIEVVPDKPDTPKPNFGSPENTPPEPPKKKIAAPVPPEALAAQVKQVFRTRCFECHGGKSTQQGIKILDRGLLIDAKKVVVPGDPDKSVLFQRISADDDSQMPPAGNPRASADEIEAVRRWIAAGAPNFPDDVAVPNPEVQDQALKDVAGVNYVLGKILAHIRTVPQHDRHYQRYFSSHHLLMAGATRQELDQQRDALAKVINHLSMEPEIIRLKCIDEPVGSVFVVNVRDLGWDKEPYMEYAGSQKEQPSSLNLFDLALLEYPYAVMYEDSDIYDQLMREYIAFAKPVRPVMYVRTDWFTSVATLFPLYEDFLQLPFTVDDLQSMFGVRQDQHDEPPPDARRSGMTVSGVSRNNRVVQHQQSKFGFFWRSFDFAGSKGIGNMFKDPIILHPTGGEMIFSLPNGLQGYFVTNGVGRRLEAAPTEIVTDKFAEDKTVRNGLSCMRCHDQGMKGFKDTVRDAINRLPGSAPGLDLREIRRIYPEQKLMDQLLSRDGDRFMNSVTAALGHPQDQEPITPVSRRFIDGPLQLTTAAAELEHQDVKQLEYFFSSAQNTTLGLEPLAAGGVVRRDTWEDYFDQVVRGLGTGIPIVPLDGLSRADYPSSNPPFAVALTTTRSNNVYAAGDEMNITVASQSSVPLYIELVGTSAEGKQVVLTKAGLVLQPNQKYKFPETGSIKVKPSVGKEKITLYCSDQPLPPGKLLRAKYCTDRVVHDFYPLFTRGAPGQHFNAARLVKKTIEIETR
jgi:serine/threonine-protein kinase